ncbi:Zn-dependent protease [Acetoanaerobium pronyense]|uniref:Zn-dependent protease n=1 Tax=Acetoanaerobium pronyense TaxID=1482736 RepID=A0ABS4KK74_9FIRM|nr:site-2 protease family protein [Acetoanaerobium pronyense]MBP2028182.1 Zn-dependent protease [Acetoanaerobium pronyense]
MVIDFLTILPGILIALTFHEFAHGAAAFAMGDDTAKRSGRLSLDPLKHIDPMGFLMLLLVRFGWAKPVPINENNFKNRNVGLFLVSIAGITMNLILALVFHFITYFSIGVIDVPAYYQVMNGIVRINIMLAAFNLLPIPPLDGSKIIYSFLPLKLRYKFYQYESYGSIILLLLLISGSIGFLLSPVITAIISFLNYLINIVI